LTDTDTRARLVSAAERLFAERGGEVEDVVAHDRGRGPAREDGWRVEISVRTTRSFEVINGSGKVQR